ncbi:hypothetical protein CDAR_495911 [Caerostris darwini]|uniref:Uncharacterized protein n=1 Tax=Caerostris darwini TaxID=1538125 RepID=A0AAV4QZ20_9ARAC|nr:hypothetical protein CDAR_495911 [Caerostris darwini]
MESGLNGHQSLLTEPESLACCPITQPYVFDDTLSPTKEAIGVRLRVSGLNGHQSLLTEPESLACCPITQPYVFDDTLSPTKEAIGVRLRVVGLFTFTKSQRPTYYFRSRNDLRQ